MRALAILGPKASLSDLNDFRLPHVELFHVEHCSADTEAAAVLIFGGDGTIHRQLQAAVKSNIPLLPVPHGSGNDFARALGITTRQDALAAWKRFCASPANLTDIDLGLIIPAGNRKLDAGNFFCCVAGVGLDSEANRRANAMPRWLRARGGYILGVVSALAWFHPPRISIELLDSRTAETLMRISESAMMVAFANAPSYGHGLRIAPRARLDDGQLDICFVRRTGKLRLLRLFPRVFTGSHLDLAEVLYQRASRLFLDSDRPLDLYADGEYVCRTPVEIAVASRALRVIVP